MPSLVALIVVVPFLLALLALLGGRRGWPRSDVVAFGPPALALAGAIVLWPLVGNGGAVVAVWDWLPSLGVQVALRADRLGVFFVFLIGAIGLGIVQYTRHYLGPKARPRFWATLLLFMGAMLGVVLADSLLLLYLFWELTTVASALLIAVDPRDPSARTAAVRAFLVTAAGGLAMLVGIVLVHHIAGTERLSELVERRDVLLASPLAGAALILLLTGALSKSAQLPFHFWLPGAMAAPAPVSAYLHSATMVKAGILLLGRLAPIFGDAPLWQPVLTTLGLATFGLASWHAFRARDIKQLLAHSTVAYLGVLTTLYGYYGTGPHRGELLHIANHAFYKSALFLLVGWLEKVANTRDIELLDRERWLPRVPWGGLVFGIAALAMAGGPFLLGFKSKELLVETVFVEPVSMLPAIVVVIFSALTVSYALKMFVAVFFGSVDPPKDRGRDPATISRWLLIVPAIFLVPQVIGGALPDWVVVPEGETAVEWPGGLAFWLYGVSPELAVKLAIFGLGGLLFFAWKPAARLPKLEVADRATRLLAKGTLAAAGWFGRAVQAGGHPRYLAVTVAFAGGMAAAGAWLARGGLVPWEAAWPRGVAALAWTPAVVVGLGAILTAASAVRLGKLLAMAIAGYGLAVLYVAYMAPDLTLTQLLVETIALLIFVLAFRKLPALAPDLRSGARRVVHAVVAIAAGLGVTVLVREAAVVGSVLPRVGLEHLVRSQPQAHGLNPVNVILVDFRGMDTFGEVLVLAIAALVIRAALLSGRAPALRERQGLAAGIPRSVPLRALGGPLVAITLVFAMDVFLRGHDAPGGGFSGGLLASAALVLGALAYGVEAAHVRLARPVAAAPWVGLALALAVALLGFPLAGGFLGHVAEIPLPGGFMLPLMTTLVFDLGILLVVVGVTLLVLDALAEATT